VCEVDFYELVGFRVLDEPWEVNSRISELHEVTTWPYTYLPWV